MSKSPLYRPNRGHGFSLVELMVAMAIVGIFLGAVFVTFTNFLGESANQASLSSQSLDARTGLNQVRRDLASAGMGMDEGDLPDAVAGNASSITIQSTGVTGRKDGNGNWAGQVGVLQSGETVNGIAQGASGVVLTPAREKVASGQLGSLGDDVSLKTTKLFFVTQLSPDYYERTYELSDDCDPSANECGDCADGTPDLQFADTNDSSGPTVKCVEDFRVRYGFQTAGGGLDFTQTDPNNQPTGSEDALPDVLKMGMLVQLGSEYRNEVRTESPVSYSDPELQNGGAVSLTTEQQQYRWKVVEWTVPLTNMP